MPTKPRTKKIVTKFVVRTQFDIYYCTEETGEGSYLGTPVSTRQEGSLIEPTKIEIVGPQDVLYVENEIEVRPRKARK